MQEQTGIGNVERTLSGEEIRTVCEQALTSWSLDGKRVLLLVPDLTRTCPLPQLFRILYAHIADRVASLDVLIALGTHTALTEEQIDQLFACAPGERATAFPRARFHNHAWDEPEQLIEVGVLTREEVREISGGLFEMEVSVTCNRRVREADELVILGPVFPHEVVGYSGGNKYIFPGISGPDILNFFHWLGAVITNPRIIGTRWTPVRKTVDRAAALVPVRRRALCMVVRGGELAGLFAGDPESAWSAAADLSQQVHVVYKERPFHTVLSCAPEMYDELWTGAKCMYKLEPVVADGGTLIIYAPHIRDVAVAHDEVIRRIGYHTRDYFLKQWEQFKHEPWGVLAHSTHVKGIGTFENGVEQARIQVVLATGIPESVCRRINLGYLDPASIRPEDYRDREEEGILYVPRAGETLFRLSNPPPALGGEENG